MKESVYAEGKAAGIYTEELIVPVVIFKSSEDDCYWAMFEKVEGLSAFGATPEAALREFGVMLQGVFRSGLTVKDVAREHHAEKETEFDNHPR